ncbi:hypothetical protein L6452_13463 [Arctium lappa]|uniref:Uncharacterized protein n=1 Tax=Arctium lappa TaxID=4217 RepID=A0ACB9CI63_ARCLA|nr:hypothetical protein L6452_13463 [Arctium lappa]
MQFTIHLFLRYSSPFLPTAPRKHFHSLRRSISAATATIGETTGNSSLLEHVAGAWYSVPELRFRDHHFTVPLDYSLSQSPKISVFAREAVAGHPSGTDQLYTFTYGTKYSKSGLGWRFVAF